MLAGGFDRETAEQWLEAGKADLIAFGRAFLATPDLPIGSAAPRRSTSRTRRRSTGGGEHGYTDYPTIEQEQGLKPRSTVATSWP